MGDHDQDKKFSLKDKIKAALADSPDAQMLQKKFKKLNLPSANQQGIKKPVLSDYQRTTQASETSAHPEKKETPPTRSKRKKPR